MTALLILGQMTNAQQGWLTHKLLGVTLSSAEWVLWLLAILSIISIAIMAERTIYFVTHQLQGAEQMLVACERNGGCF